MRVFHAWRFLSVLCWLVVAGMGAWSYWSLGGIGELTAEGDSRTALDKWFRYLFLPLVLYGVYMARKEYKQACAEILLAEPRLKKGGRAINVRKRFRAC
ncbi:hypothetical protein IMCC3135_09195 [Granulosicoccus antarcticus IMCC3135]|uniref:Uncharacterized protein n=1 Tax=Granulosicoccus antarcticus IMCC3135 TaxID=1192854 RepID=A0A2Z2NKV0_9GAMM|nr:hypothetical protein IMCC3135_09195 [Granulosicoccus antarcticus IMCC3135]